MKLSFKSKTNTLWLASLLVCAVFMLYPGNGNKAFAVDCTSDAACWATETCQSYLIATIWNHTTAPVRDSTSCIWAPISCWWDVVGGSARIFDGNSFQGSTDWVNLYNTKEQISNCLARKTSDGSCYSSSTPWSLWNGWWRAYPSNVLNANLWTQNFKDITKNQYTIPYTNMAFITPIIRYNWQGATDYWRIVGSLSLARSSSAGVCAPASAKCWSASGATYNIWDIVPSMNLCSVWTPRAFWWNYTAPLESTGTTRSWVCDSSSNTWTNTCTLTVAWANDPPPYVPWNVKCGTANGKSYEVGTTVTDSYCVDWTKIDLQMQWTSFAWAKNYWYCSGWGKATPTCSFAVVWGCYDEVDPDVCKGPYTAGVCYKPWASRWATTLLVKDSKVAINSDDVDPSGAALLVNWAEGVRGTVLVNYSDVRIKTNIQKINNALADITRLNGYEFTWIEWSKPDFGVLAQEVEKVFASMVSEDSKGIKAVNYTELLAPIIEAIHEINTRVDELTREAQEQALRIETLEK